MAPCFELCPKVSSWPKGLANYRQIIPKRGLHLRVFDEKLINLTEPLELDRWFGSPMCLALSLVLALLSKSANGFALESCGAGIGTSEVSTGHLFAVVV